MSIQCDNYRLNKGDLSRCCGRARYQLTILDRGDIDILLRCQACRNELYAEIESGVVTFEILDEVPAGVRVVAGVLAVNELPQGTVILGQARKCTAPGCCVVFVPTHPRQKYHSQGCVKQARKARL